VICILGWILKFRLFGNLFGSGNLGLEALRREHGRDNQGASMTKEYGV